METKDIFKEVASQVNKTIKIDSVSFNSETGEYTILTKCTKWISVCDTVTIKDDADQDQQYEVESFVLNESVVLKPETSGDKTFQTSFDLKDPFFINGTIKGVQKEITQEYNKEEIYPMIWLYEIIKDEEMNDPLSMIERESDVRLYFIATADTGQWTTNDHYNYIVYPMKQLVNEFIEVMKQSRWFTETFKTIKTNLLNISIEGKQKNGIFDYNISGIELRIFSKIRRDLSCSSNNC